MRFVYFFMGDDTAGVQRAAPDHAGYWHDLSLPGYLGGPFADRSGGMITFEARSPDEASDLVASDPFIKRGLLRRHWLKEWATDRSPASPPRRAGVAVQPTARARVSLGARKEPT